MTDPAGSPNLYAPPETHVDDVRPEGETELATRASRLAAAIVDGLIYGVVYWIVVLFVFQVQFMAIAMLSIWMKFGLQAAGIGVFLALNGWLLAKHGQTIGKKILGIRIVRMSGAPASFGRIVGLRLLPMWLVALIPFIGVVVVLLDPLFIFRTSRRCLHDSIADTVVVNV